MTQRPIALAIALAFAASSALFGCDNTSNLTEQEHIQRAKDFEDQGKLNGSIIELKNAIQRNPDSPQARLLLGQVYLKVGRGPEAEKEFSRAESLGVSREAIKPQLGEALLLMGEYKRVLDEINPGEKTSKSNLARIHQIRADAMIAQGQVANACDLYQKSLEIDKENPPTYWGLAKCAVARQDMAAARAWLDDALKIGSRQARTWVYIGEWEQLNNNPEDALAAYSNALKIEPNTKEALQNRAILNMALKQTDAAQADVEKISKLAPKSLASFYLLALLDFERKKYPEAREKLQEVSKITSDHMPSVLLTGATNYELGSYQQAENHLVRFLSRYPGHRYGRSMLAATQIKLKQPDKALHTLAPLLASDPRDGRALILAAEAYRAKHDPIQSTKYLTRAAEIDPANAAIRTELGSSHLAAGDSQLAIMELGKAAALDPGRPNVDILLVMAHLERKEYDKALTAIADLEKKLKNSAMPPTMRGSALLGKGDIAGARKSFEQAVAIDPGFFPASASLAQLDMRDKKPADAKKRFERILEKDKDNLQAMMALAELAARNKQDKDMVGWLEKAAKAHSRAIPPRAVLARHFLVRKQTQKALALANEAANANPGNPIALDLLGSVQLAVNDSAGAISTYTKLAQQAAQSPNAHERLARAQIAGSKLADARSSLQNALKLQPDHEPSLDTQIRLEMMEKKPARALQFARQLQASQPQSALGFEREGDIHLSEKRPDVAAKSYEQALARGAGSPVLIKSHRALALANNPGATQKLENWLAKHPNDNAVRFYAAEYYGSIGRHQDAIAAYKTLLTQLPGTAIALNNLANSYQRVGDKRARATAEQAYKLDRDHPAILDTLGWLLVEQGQTARGLELIEKALSKVPGNPDIRYHRVMARLAQSGDKARARRELELLLKEAPTFSQAEAAKAQLRKL